MSHDKFDLDAIECLDKPEVQLYNRGMAKTPALLKALTVAGSATALADKIGITRAAVSQWKQVPAERVLEVERLTGVPRYELRPDIFGEAA